jgi:hypothetical protein
MSCKVRIVSKPINFGDNKLMIRAIKFNPTNAKLANPMVLNDCKLLEYTNGLSIPCV